MSDWGPERPYLRVVLLRPAPHSAGVAQGECGSCGARVAMSAQHCPVYPPFMSGGREDGCGQKFEYYVTPFPEDRTEIERLTSLPYKRVAWG